MKPIRPALVATTLAGAFVAAPAAASDQLHMKSGCIACHMVDKKLVGPSYRDIAAKYTGRADAVPYLSQRVRKGGPGNWGTVPMAANDVSKLTDADLTKLLNWILATPQAGAAKPAAPATPAKK
jgi:cytochrome c